MRVAEPGVAVDVLLVDGRIATIRPIRPDDHDAVLALHRGMADENVRLRFFSLNRSAAETYAERLTTPGAIPLALAAFLGDHLVAVASAEPGDPDTAEVSFVVDDQAHGLGLGTLLLEHLAAAGRDRGIRHFTAVVLADNSAMLHVFTDCGFDLTRAVEPGTISLRLDTAATARAVAAADERESHAEARSLAPLLYPRSVAVVGVRRAGGGVGRAVVGELVGGGYTGTVYVVHPEQLDLPGTVGITDLSSLAGLPEPVDLIVVAVPAAAVLPVVRSAAEAGIRAAVVLTAGFSEAGADGARMQRELVEVARRHSMRLVGPNCLGLVSAGDDVRLNATFTAGLPRPGRLAIASQSGGVGIALLDQARETGTGIATFVSLGNKADVSGNDLLAAWQEDDRVGAVALYLESFGNARKFARVARRFSERKPLLAVVGGRSAGGKRAGASHTAAAAAPAVGIDALFAQAGVIGCRGLTELGSTARLLLTQPLPGGPRVAIVGNAGGLGVLAADAAAAQGLVVPELSPVLRQRLDDVAPGSAAVTNPVDLGAAASAAALSGATGALLDSGEVDSVVLIVAGTLVTDADAFLADLGRTRGDDPAVPLLLVALGDVTVPEAPGAFARFPSVEDATAALAHATSYAAWRASPGDASPEPEDPTTAAAARAVAIEALAGLSETPFDGWLDHETGSALLAPYGLAGPRSGTARGAAAAVRLAEQIGFPVVVKVGDPSVVHKTDRGLVRTDLTNQRAVRTAVTHIGQELGTRKPTVLVQEQVPTGIEVAVGVVRDPGFGPMVMVAAGGIATDVWNDRVFLLPPLSEQDAARAVRSLRIWPLLAGFRGAEPVDVPALERLVRRVGRLALDVPEIAELDLNPVITSPSGVACVDLKVRLAAPGAPDDAGVPRRLRPPS